MLTEHGKLKTTTKHTDATPLSTSSPATPLPAAAADCRWDDRWCSMCVLEAGVPL